ncbi:hypothetical protein AALA90_00665 [Lachnospiraceae bacterium 38-10]
MRRTEEGGQTHFRIWIISAVPLMDVREARIFIGDIIRSCWITGTQQLVDCTVGHGKERTKILKVYLSNFGFLPGRIPKESSTDFPDDPETTAAAPPPVEVLDGERESLPE